MFLTENEAKFRESCMSTSRRFEEFCKQKQPKWASFSFLSQSLNTIKPEYWGHQ